MIEGNRITIKCLSYEKEQFFDCLLNKLDKLMRQLPQLKEELKRLNYELANIYYTKCNKDLDYFLPIFIEEIKKFFKEKGYELEIVQKCIQTS